MISDIVGTSNNVKMRSAFLLFIQEKVEQRELYLGKNLYF